MKANLAASIRQRLLNRARQEQETFDAVLNRFGRSGAWCRPGSQGKVLLMALHCCSRWAIRSISSWKLGTSPRSIPESVMAL